jgi:ribonucleoside-diphosphate reductase alpha chain
MSKKYRELSSAEITDRIDQLKEGRDFPSFMNKPSLVTLYSGYLDETDTPNSRIMDIAHKVAKTHGKPELFDAVYKFVTEHRAFSFSSPIWSNFATDRGLPISCFNTYIPDSIEGIYDRQTENAVMTQNGGGTSSYWGDVRGMGAPITGGGTSTGAISFMEGYEEKIKKVSQGGVRRGMHVVYINIEHDDFWEFMKIRDPKFAIQKMTHAICVSDEFIEKLYDGDQDAGMRWAKVLEKRNDHGVPYLFYTGNANNHPAMPKCYGKNSKGLYPILGSNLCNEIFLPSGLDESFVCCLLSMNLFTFDTWKDVSVNGYGAVETAVYVLDAVMTEFIDKAEKLGRPMERAVKFARRHRALGVGVFGLHDYYQKKSIPFTGLMANATTRLIFGHIKEEAYRTSSKMADEYGASEVCKEFGIHRRHTTLMAMAPTTTNALIAGGLSQGIEPHAANAYIKTVAKGKFMFKNKALEALLESKGHNTDEVWESIRLQSGSVAFLDILTDDEKEVFKTFSEINQFEIIEQAAIRQNYIDQGQSLNIFVPPSTPADVRSKLHLMAHAYGLKGLYYQRSFSDAQGFMMEGRTGGHKTAGKTGLEHIDWESSMDGECTSCEG